MTIRAYMATQIMVGMLASGKFPTHDIVTPEHWATAHADALIAELNRDHEKNLRRTDATDTRG